MTTPPLSPLSGNLSECRVAVLGAGVEGISTHAFLTRHSINAQLLDDRVGEPITELERFNVVVRSPGVSLHHPALKQYQGELTSAYELFMQWCPSSCVIGITGTKGKGSTTTYLEQILTTAGHTVHVRGNIGRAFFEEYELIGIDDIVILELSSFQLWNARLAPATGVVLPFAPDHLDVHHDLNEYYAAKAQLWRADGMQRLYVRREQEPEMLDLIREVDERSITWCGTPWQTDDAVRIEDKVMYFHGDPLISLQDVPVRLPVDHTNAATALLVADQYGITREQARSALQRLAPLPMRMERIGEDSHGRVFWNNSYATLPTATIATLDGFDGDDRVLLILGGRNKGLTFDQLAVAIATSPATIDIALIGESAAEIDQALHRAGIPSSYRIHAHTLERVIADIVPNTPEHTHVVLAPACASFDQFSNVKHRGERFNALVAEYIAASGQAA